LPQPAPASTAEDGPIDPEHELRPATRRAVLGRVEDRRDVGRLQATRLLFVVGLVAWSSLAAWWATYFYRTTIEVRDATVRAYAAEEKLEAIEQEQLGLDVDGARKSLAGTVFTVAHLPFSADEEEYPYQVLRGHLAENAIVVRPEERLRLRTQLRRKMIMLLGEGSVLIGLLFVCLMVLYRMLMGELGLRRHQESFVHAVTHELKSPLTGLRSLLQNFATIDIPRADRATYVELGIREIDRLDRLVANILLSSRLEADAFQPRVVAVDIAATLLRIQEHKRRLFQERGGDVLVDAPAGLQAQADPEALEMVLENLVDNALKYGLERPTVRLEARAKGRRVTVVIADNGVGLSPADLAQVFDKFYRAPAGEVRHAKGSGLGLFIAKGLARTLGGDLTVQSEGVNRGATFTLELPA